MSIDSIVEIREFYGKQHDLILGAAPEFTFQNLLLSLNPLEILFLSKVLRQKFEQKKYYCNLEQADQVILSRLLLLRWLREKQIEPTNVVIVNSADEKTFKQPLIEIDNQKGKYFISITHRAYFAGITLSQQPIGIDLEIVNEKKPISFQNYAFGDEEIQWLNLLPENLIALGQMLLWTSKEALSKCLGTGLQQHPQEFRIQPPESVTDTKFDFCLNFKGKINIEKGFNFRLQSQVLTLQKHKILLTSASRIYNDIT